VRERQRKGEDLGGEDHQEFQVIGQGQESIFVLVHIPEDIKTVLEVILVVPHLVAQGIKHPYGIWIMILEFVIVLLEHLVHPCVLKLLLRRLVFRELAPSVFALDVLQHSCECSMGLFLLGVLIEHLSVEVPIQLESETKAAW